MTTSTARITTIGTFDADGNPVGWEVSEGSIDAWLVGDLRVLVEIQLNAGQEAAEHTAASFRPAY